MNNHITNILDEKPIAALDESDMATIRAHVESCSTCRESFQAARLSALLLSERASEAADHAANANPFFETRVLAAWRERQSEGISALRRLWNATGALVSTMAATTAALAVLTFAVPASDTTSQSTAALVPYSAESVVLGGDDDQVTDDQVLNAIYADDEGGK